MSASSRNPDDVTRVAIIGAGGMAREHARAFRAVPGVQVAGIFGRTHARAESLAAEFGIPSICDSVAELYEKTHARLVVVAVSELSTRGIVDEARQFPWTLLLEKPPGYDLADAEAIRAALAASGRRAFVGMNRRFYGSTRAVTDDLNHIDGPRLIAVRDQEDPEEARAAGRPEQVVANWMYANSIHLIDFFRFLGRGTIERVEPVVPYDPAAPRFVISTITYSSGDVGLYEGIWNAPSPWVVSVTTAQKRWELRPIETAQFQLRGERRLTPVAATAWDTDFKAGFRMQAEQAVRAARGEPSESITLDDALLTMRLIARIFAQTPSDARLE
ncbi:MAG TPA: Gfo/Idh/MocA family oxidoreductase [Gemmatimonadaceae bacterium]|nr:Gfo/Idh/MocA family oxidoreductase [Gemmatimonadaceae bacterium]